MNKSKWKLWLAFLVLVVLITPSHIIENDKVITLDEPWWVISGSNYYYALTHQDFANTLYDYHPAVTTTWVVTAGMLTYFPEYRGLGQGYFDVRKPKFEKFMRENGRETLELVRTSRLIQTMLLLALALLGFFLLQYLVDQRAAFLAIALAMTGPFFLGHARLLNHEGMLAMFVLVSFLGMQVYLHKGRNLIYLLISGAMFGFAQLTKSTSIALAGVVGLMLFAEIFKRNGVSLWGKIGNAAKTMTIWLGTALLITFVFWPGMWVAPGKMLSGVYGNAFSYAFQGARLDVTQNLDVSAFNPSVDLNGLINFFKNWLFSSTLITWGGFLSALLSLFSTDRNHFPNSTKSLTVYLIILGTMFMLLFGVAQGRNSQHYLLSSYVSFDVAAGMGWWYAWTRLQNRWQFFRKETVSLTALILWIGIQIAFGVPCAPYYFNYKNPLASRPVMTGYGEGYSEAAEYLAAKPNAQELQAYVYNGMGTFSFFFPGDTLVLKRVHLLTNDLQTIVNETKASDYLVLYPITRRQYLESEILFKQLEGVVEPEKTIHLNGLEYLQIYRVSDIPETVYESLLETNQ